MLYDHKLNTQSCVKLKIIILSVIVLIIVIWKAVDCYFLYVLEAYTQMVLLFTQEMTFCNNNIVVGIATGYGLDYQGVGVQVLVGARIFISPRHPDRLWDPPSLLSGGYWGFFPQG
jgi:hypothetical protein